MDPSLLKQTAALVSDAIDKAHISEGTAQKAMEMGDEQLANTAASLAAMYWAKAGTLTVLMTARGGF